MNSQKKGVCFAQPTMIHKSMNSVIFQKNNEQNSNFNEMNQSQSNVPVSENTFTNQQNNENNQNNQNNQNQNNQYINQMQKNQYINQMQKNQIKLTNFEKLKLNQSNSIKFNNLNKNYITPASNINSVTSVNNRQNFKFNLEQENQMKHLQFLQQIQTMKLNQNKIKKLNNKISNTITSQKITNPNISMIKHTIR